MDKTPQDALNEYTAAMKDLNKHLEQNKSVFDTHQNFVFRVMDAENALRDSVSMSKRDISNREFEVKYRPQTMIYGDVDVLNDMIAKGEIPAHRKAEVIKTVDRPAKIIISAIKND